MRKNHDIWLIILLQLQPGKNRWDQEECSHSLHSILAYCLIIGSRVTYNLMFYHFNEFSDFEKGVIYSFLKRKRRNVFCIRFQYWLSLVPPNPTSRPPSLTLPPFCAMTFFGKPLFDFWIFFSIGLFLSLYICDRAWLHFTCIERQSLEKLLQKVFNSILNVTYTALLPYSKLKKDWCTQRIINKLIYIT